MHILHTLFASFHRAIFDLQKRIDIEFLLNLLLMLLYLAVHVVKYTLRLAWEYQILFLIEGAID